MPRLSPDLTVRLRVLAWRARPLAAAACAGLAVTAAVERWRPPDPPTTAVLVAARDLALGATVAADDLAERAVPVADTPMGAGHDLGALVGRRLGVAVPSGLPIVPELLVDDATTGPPGTVVVPVRFADPAVADLLAPGTTVDVVAAGTIDGQQPRRVAGGALVLARPVRGDDGASGTGGLLGGSGTDDDVPVLLAVAPEEAVALSGAGSTTVFGAVIVG